MNGWKNVIRDQQEEESPTAFWFNSIGGYAKVNLTANDVYVCRINGKPRMEFATPEEVDEYLLNAGINRMSGWS